MNNLSEQQSHQLAKMVVDANEENNNLFIDNIIKEVFSEIKSKIIKKTFKDIVLQYNLLIQFKNHRINVLNNLKKNFRRNKTQKSYAIEYMLKYPTKLIKQGDLLLYCDKRRCEDTNGKEPNFKDNSRGIEHLRKDTMPNCWKEKRINGDLYFMYIPELKELITEEIINNTKHKKDRFDNEIIKSKLNECDNKCELTGLPVSEGNLAGDHWIPKEGGGLSTSQNCIILNKILNEKKNKHNPIDWFCNSILTNFLKICKKTGMNLDDVKAKLIKSIQEF